MGFEYSIISVTEIFELVWSK